MNYASSKDDYEFLLKERFKEIKNKVEIYQADVREKNKLENAMLQISPQYVVVLAALIITNPKLTKIFYDDIVSTNVIGT